MQIGLYVALCQPHAPHHVIHNLISEIEDRWLWKLSELAMPACCLHSNQTLSWECCDGMAGTANPVWLANQIWELQTNGCIISVSHVRAVCTLMLCHLSHLSVAGLQRGLIGERMRLIKNESKGSSVAHVSYFLLFRNTVCQVRLYSETPFWDRA